MSNSFDFDLFVIGGGSGGVRAARWAAKLGARVALVEKSRLGGTCVIRGCVPKKFMVYASEFSHDAAVMKDYGWDITLGSFNWSQFKKSRDSEVERLSGIYKRMLEGSGVELFEGVGCIDGENTVLIKGKKITAKHILIAVGSRPYLPNFKGVEHTLTSNQFFKLEQRPQKVLIAGGGYIAVEFAGILRGLGSDVSVVIRREHILRGFDQDVREFLQDQMSEKGISFLTEQTIEEIEKEGEQFHVTFSDKSRITYDAVLMAQGRVPATEDLQLNKIGIDHTDGKIKVDARFATSLNSVYALGDCVNDHNLTPVALNEGMILAENLFNEQNMKMNYENIPTAVFSQPPIGTVGISEEQAKAKGFSVDIYMSSFSPLKFALSSHKEKCLMKLIVDSDSQVVLGVHIVGKDAGEMIQGVGIAVKAKLTKDQFDSCVGVHPTSAEEFVTMREKTR